MIVILRLDHRPERDKRISTHCGLAARALGADKIVYTGERDDTLLNTIKDVSKRWGGRFRAEYADNWKKVVKSARRKKFTIVHLTMYGLPYERKAHELRKKRNLLVIVGSEKVPRPVYDSADYNISVTNQPHSEVAALALFLNALRLKAKHTKPQLRVIPQAKGKKVIEPKRKLKK
jgi:tRNA (cytidine56-2'-O)-methyltransferase